MGLMDKDISYIKKYNNYLFYMIKLHERGFVF